MLRNLFTLLLLSGLFIAHAQEQIGLNPPSVKWQQINTPGGNIIFPKGLRHQALRQAALMNYQREHDAALVGERVTKNVPIILQNQSIFPAGFSTPAPWRNELYLSYPQNPFLGPVIWPDVLGIHEYRHTQQFYMARGGFTVPLRILMGQTGWILDALTVQPLWFREGDATLAETIYTKGGRGRLPSFHMEYRAMRLAGYHYNYEKAHFYSYKDFVPNPYRLGYYMVSKARKDYGTNIWEKVLYDAHYKKSYFYPFSRALKEHTGMGTKDFYQATMEDVDSMFQKTDEALELTDYTAVSDTASETYTSYRFPHYLPDGSIVALKSGLNLIDTYYKIDGKEERRLFAPGVYTDDHVTTVIEGYLMTWAEAAFHERWVNKDYSVIKIHDFSTGKTKKLSSKSRYFSPAPSFDGKKVVVHETDVYNNFYITTLDIATKKVIKKTPTPEGMFCTHLRWMADNLHVVAVAINDKGNSIIRINTETGEATTVLPVTTIPVSRPYPSGDFVFFSAGYTGINNIYAVAMNTKQVFQLTSDRFGAFEPVVSEGGSKLLYTAYTADGYQLKEMELRQESWKPLTSNLTSDITFHEIPLEQEGKDLAGLLVDTTYEVKKYHAFTAGLFNIYGWFPVPSPPEYGLELYTRNIMSTLRGTIGVLYNTNEDKMRYRAQLEYAAFYPVVDINYEHAGRRAGKATSDTISPDFYDQEWRENTMSAGLRFPFKLTQGTHHSNLTVGGYYEYFDISALDSMDTKSIIGRNNFHGWKVNLNFSRLRDAARQHVKPRWGQFLSAEYRTALDENVERLHVWSQLFFPGLFRNHSLYFRGSYKMEEVVNTYRYVDDYVMPRGYLPAPYEDIYLATINYEMPLWYPDISLGSVAFFQRLRGSVFFDYANGSMAGFNQEMASAGAVVYVDLRLLRLFQMTMAFRYNYVFDDHIAKTTPFEFLVTQFELAN